MRLSRTVPKIIGLPNNQLLHQCFASPQGNRQHGIIQTIRGRLIPLIEKLGNDQIVNAIDQILNACIPFHNAPIPHHHLPRAIAGLRAIHHTVSIGQPHAINPRAIKLKNALVTQSAQWKIQRFREQLFDNKHLRPTHHTPIPQFLPTIGNALAQQQRLGHVIIFYMQHNFVIRIVEPVNCGIIHRLFVKRLDALIFQPLQQRQNLTHVSPPFYRLNEMPLQPIPHDLITTLRRLEIRPRNQIGIKGKRPRIAQRHQRTIKPRAILFSGQHDLVPTRPC